MKIRVLCTREENIPSGSILKEYEFKEKFFNGIIRTFDLEYYVKGVVAAEMLVNWEKEAYKAQSIAARTYALRYIESYYDNDFHITDLSGYHQAFRIGKIREEVNIAVDETCNMILMYNNKVIENAVYSASNGGTTYKLSEDNKTKKPWYGKDVDYIQHRIDPYNKHERHGHGYGMSQWGALHRAEAGHNYKQILEFYYPNTKLVSNYNETVETSDILVKTEDKEDINMENVKICFDPGHYLKYNGYSTKPDGSQYYESEAMLELGLKLKEAIPNVVLTRENASNKSLDLVARSKIASANKVDYCISLHTNSSPKVSDKEEKGILVFYSIDIPSDKSIAEKLAKLINKHTGIAVRAVKYWESKKYKGEDYLGMIDHPQDYGIPHVFLVEHGSHWQFSADYENNINGCVKAYKEFFGVNDEIIPDGSTTNDEYITEPPYEPDLDDFDEQRVIVSPEDTDSLESDIESPEYESQYPEYYSINVNNYLNIRKSPNGDILGKLHANDIVQYYGNSSGSWKQIKTEEFDGWVHGDYLIKTSKPNIPENPTETDPIKPDEPQIDIDNSLLSELFKEQEENDNMIDGYSKLIDQLTDKNFEIREKIKQQLNVI